MNDCDSCKHACSFCYDQISCVECEKFHICMKCNDDYDLYEPIEFHICEND